MTDLLAGDASSRLHLDKVYETDMAEALKAMVLAGHGVAFLPESAVVDSVARGELVDLAPPGKAAAPWHLDMEIRLYRDRLAYTDASNRRELTKRDALEAFWQAVRDQIKG